MQRPNIRDYSRVKARLTQWFCCINLVAEKLRGALLGAIITITIAEVCAYKLLKQNVMAGDLPPYIIDLLIILLALLEAVVSPFLGWFGRNRRRTILPVACVVAGASPLLWFALPEVDVPEQVGYCNSNNTSSAVDSTPGTPIRLTIILVTFIVFGITRVMIWCHGIAYIDEHAPSRLSMHYGVLSTIRMLGLAMGYNIMTDILEANMTLQTLLICIGLIVNGVQMLMNIPRVAPQIEEAPKLPMDDLRFLSSVSRVFSNTLATSLMVAMGLITAALWGFAYHQTDFLKAKYYLHLERNPSVNYAELFRNHAVILAVAYMGLKFTPPIMPNVLKTSVLIHAAKMCVFSIILYILMVAAINCKTGNIAGLQEKNYIQPQCSQICGCVPQWQEFSPVCVVDEMTTYLSPCHAGCSGIEEVGGLKVFTNCACGTLNRRATSGSCSSSDCSGAFQLHQMFFALLLSVSAMAVQSLGVVLLRDTIGEQSLALGMCGATVAIFTFVCGHLVFLGISGGNCIWQVGGRCHLQSKTYPYLIGSVSAGMVLFAFVIIVTTVVFMKRAERRAKTAPTETTQHLNDTQC